MLGLSEPPKEEDTKYNGRVFRILVYDAPFVILEPLDGIGEPLEARQIGPITMIPFGGNFVPSAIRLDARTGLKLARVGPEYAAMFQKHFVPPDELMQKRQQPPSPPVPPGPIGLSMPGLLALYEQERRQRQADEGHDAEDCDKCDERDKCPMRQNKPEE